MNMNRLQMMMSRMQDMNMTKSGMTITMAVLHPLSVIKSGDQCETGDHPGHWRMSLLDSPPTSQLGQSTVLDFVDHRHCQHGEYRPHITHPIPHYTQHCHTRSWCHTLCLPLHINRHRHISFDLRQVYWKEYFVFECRESLSLSGSVWPTWNVVTYLCWFIYFILWCEFVLGAVSCNVSRSIRSHLQFGQ